MASELDKLIMDRLKRLPPERQREVLDFVEFLERKTAPASGRPPLRGIFADLEFLESCVLPMFDDIVSALISNAILFYTFQKRGQASLHS